MFDFILPVSTKIIRVLQLKSTKMWNSYSWVDSWRWIATVLFKHILFNTDPTSSYSVGSFGISVTHAFQYSDFVDI